MTVPVEKQEAAKQDLAQQEPPKHSEEPAATPGTSEGAGGASDDENISHTRFELYRHTMLRGANLGSVLSLLIAPPYLWFRGVRSPREFAQRTGSITAKGMACGIVFGILRTLWLSRNFEEEEYYDRCYRIRHNKGQVRTDKFTYGGIVLGGIGGMAAGLGTSPVIGGVQGASMGVGLAVLGHVLTKQKEKK